MQARFDNPTAVLDVIGMSELELEHMLRRSLPRAFTDLRDGIREYRAAFLMPETHRNMASRLRDYVADYLDQDRVSEDPPSLTVRELRWIPALSIRGVRIYMRRVELPLKFMPPVLDIGICHTIHSPVI